MENIAEAQRGILPPRVVSHVLLLETLKNSVSSFPTDSILPFPLGRDYLFALHQLSDVRLHTYRKCPGYVISLPLVNKRTFTTRRMVPIPVPVDQDHFLYMDVQDSVLCLGQNKQYYFTMQEGELDKCKLAGPDHNVCTHQRTLLSTVATDSCAVALLHKRDKLPPVCDTTLIRLSNTVWTQLLDFLCPTAWHYYRFVLRSSTCGC